MAKGYWVARVNVHDAESYKEYVSLNGVVFAKFGGRFLVRGGPFEAPLGTPRQRNVVLEFPSYQAALDCWNSEDYQTVRAKQKGGADVELLVIEGYDGPQPTEQAGA